MKLNYWKRLVSFMLILFILTIAFAAMAQTTNGVTLAPDQQASLDNSIHTLIPLVPQQYQGIVAGAILILAALAKLGRFITGWRDGGFFGAIKAVFTGSANVIKALLLVGVCTLVFTGCKSTQVVENESGTGMKLKMPVGWNGNNIAELDLTVGTFKHTTLVQPTSTNQLYSPTLVVVATTRGRVEATSLNTNNAVNTSGGDAYVITTGDADAAITNSADILTRAWQNAPENHQ